MKNKTKTTWRLKSIEIQFQKGFAFKEKEEEKHDRYVGKISFSNDQDESFNLQIPSNMTTRYMDLMREEIVRTAESLGRKIADSLRELDQTASK